MKWDDLDLEKFEEDPPGGKFEYILSLPTPAEICFGSTLPRESSKALSSYQRRILGNLEDKLSPAHYDLENQSIASLILNKVGSSKGVGSRAHRFKSHKIKGPGPGDHVLQSQFSKPKVCKAPFNSTAKIRWTKDPHVPGIGTYFRSGVYRCRRSKVLHNFDRPLVVPLVETKCETTATTKCLKCGDLCRGDYWQMDQLFLCHLCWVEEIHGHEIFSKKEIEQFHKTRNCHYMHWHNNTTAAVRLMTTHQIKKKWRMENYLGEYIRDTVNRPSCPIDSILGLKSSNRVAKEAYFQIAQEAMDQSCLGLVYESTEKFES